MNVSAILDNLPLYWGGLVTTVQLLAASLACGLVVAIPLAILRVSPKVWLSRPVWLFTFILCGTPMLVQLFLIYYGLPQFAWVREGPFWSLLSSAWFCALLTFALNTCAYTTEIIAGAIRATPAGEIEAARSAGFSAPKLWVRIVLPSALRRALPAYGNEVIFMLHGTSLASIVTLVDLTGAAREMNSTHYLPFEAFVTAGLFYLALTFTLVGLFHLAERHFLAFLRPR